jgi:hypothetical protein
MDKATYALLQEYSLMITAIYITYRIIKDINKKY